MPKFNSYPEARQAFAQDRVMLEKAGLYFGGAQAYLPENFRFNSEMAMDAIPGLSTDPNSSIPAMLSTYIDPELIEVIFTPTKIAEIWGEERKGDWVTDTAAFPVVEQTGEVSSYGDYANNGRAGVNMNWPQFQQYRYQLIIQYGDLESERAGLAKINYVAELNRAAADVMSRFENTMYAFGIAGLQNYGALNNPYFAASLTPATKTAGGTAWDKATANEIADDVTALVVQLISQLGGNIDKSAKMTLALGPSREALFAKTNSFNVNVTDILKKNFPGLRVVTAVQFESQSATNPQGNLAGNLMQLKADQISGQRSGFSAFAEKLRAHRIIPGLSSFMQKRSAGGWGTIVRMPMAVASMVNI